MEAGMNRPELERIIRRCKDDLNALDVAIKRKEMLRSQMEEALIGYEEKLENWGADDGA